MSIRGKAAIVGFAELPTRKEYPGRSSLGLFAEVAREAMRDSGLRKEDIDGLITHETTNALTVAEVLGMQPRFTASMTAWGASGAVAVATAAQAVASGAATYVLCVLGESRRPNTAGSYASEESARTGSLTDEWESPFGPVAAANGGYGLIKQRHMYQYGTTQEQFAQVVVAERYNASQNVNAVWYDKPVTAEQVLASRYTNDPLHLLESVMPCSAAYGVIVTTAERARALPHPPVHILGTGGPSTTHSGIWQARDATTTPVAVSAPLALQMAQVNINEVQFAEFYDCYTILVMACLEDAGIVHKGEIGGFYEETDTTFAGSFPINTDGGQLGGGQAGYGGGLRHVVEAARQIQRRAEHRQVQKSDLALVNGWGLTASVMCTLVLGSSATL